MLVASLNGERAEAENAERGLAFVCPNCKRPVILKRGPIVIAHFAHKPPTDCSWARGETKAHLDAKKLFRDTLAARGLRAEVEFVVPSLPDDRRADVMIWSPKRERLALELQHTSLGLEDIERRAFSYAHAGIAQTWIPFLRSGIWKDAKRRSGDEDGNYVIERYPARPFERWIHGFHKGGVWFYDPSRKTLWRGLFTGSEIYVEESSWYEEGGEERYAGGFYRFSKRWRKLTLWGPYELNQVKIRIDRRNAWAKAHYRWPAGGVGNFVIDK